MTTRWMPWCATLILCAGCVSAQDEATRQVGSAPFPDQRVGGPITKVSYAPASQDASVRVEVIGRKLILGQKQADELGFRPMLHAIGAPDPEIFHVGMAHIYVTETLVKQCTTDGQLAAVLANELGRMISEREAAVSEQVRAPERLSPIAVPIGREPDPTSLAELGFYEKQFPRQPRKSAPPNPQLIARRILEKAGYQATELDGALPILQNADRFSALGNQSRGALKQSDWK